MRKTDPLLIEKCRKLREKGFTLGEIIKAIGLPKTTVYHHIRDIPLSNILKEKIKKIRKETTKETNLRTSYQFLSKMKNFNLQRSIF